MGARLMPPTKLDRTRATGPLTSQRTSRSRSCANACRSSSRAKVRAKAHVLSHAEADVRIRVAVDAKGERDRRRPPRRGSRTRRRGRPTRPDGSSCRGARSRAVAVRRELDDRRRPAHDLLDAPLDEAGVAAGASPIPPGARAAPACRRSSRSAWSRCRPRRAGRSTRAARPAAAARRSPGRWRPRSRCRRLGAARRRFTRSSK